MFVVVLCTARLTMISTDDPFHLSTVIQGLQMKTLRTQVCKRTGEELLSCLAGETHTYHRLVRFYFLVHGVENMVV